MTSIMNQLKKIYNLIIKKMSFRSPELVKRYEYAYYDLDAPLNSIVANNESQTKGEYRFTVDNSSEANPID